MISIHVRDGGQTAMVLAIAFLRAVSEARRGVEASGNAASVEDPGNNVWSKADCGGVTACKLLVSGKRTGAAAENTHE